MRGADRADSNMQSLANDTGISHTTVQQWISILEASYIVVLLKPWYRNISKRLIKSPKLYFYDVGLCLFAGYGKRNACQSSSVARQSFENLALIEAMKYSFNRGRKNAVTFYRDSRGNEVDMILESGQEIFPIEVKGRRDDCG